MKAARLTLRQDSGLTYIQPSLRFSYPVCMKVYKRKAENVIVSCSGA